tara:strand:- start:1418 stop:1813 length:396 start_codon:yes stop_codon:yes gene_type:complete
MPLTPPVTFSDIDLSLTANPVTRDIAELQNEQAIGQSIRNILATDNGERLFRPDLGAGIRQMLFEPMNAFTEAKMQTAIELAIEAQEPRVIVQEIRISGDPDNYKYDIFVICIVKDTQQEIEVVQTLTRGR